MSNDETPNVLIEKRIRELLASIQDQVHPLIIEQVVHFLQVGELRVAVENLCELLSEERVALAQLPYDRLLALANDLNIDMRHCSTLLGPGSASR
jgi:hypothetical protein